MLAYAIASLDRSDTTEARRLVVKTLWRGPVATVLPTGQRRPWSLAFSPDGQHLAVGRWVGSSSSNIGTGVNPSS